MGCITTTMALIFINFYLSDYTAYLLFEVKVNMNTIGFIFGLIAASVCLSAPIVGYISKRIPRIYLAQSVFVTIPLALILFGPSKLFELP